MGILYKRPMTFSGENLSCLRGQSLVFEDISFAVERGRMLALTGANGSGKTSLLRVMAGLLPPASGTLRWDGADEMPEGAVHWIGPDNALKPDLTVAENLEFWLSSQPLPSGRGWHAAGMTGEGNDAADITGPHPNPLPEGRGGVIGNVLSNLSLSTLADTPVRCLSVGQKRRAALCRLFLSPRPLWLLDEPETGLDAATAEKLRTLVRAHANDGGMVVIATHRPDVWGADISLDLKALSPVGRGLGEGHDKGEAT